MKTRTPFGGNEARAYRACGLTYRPKWIQILIDIGAIALGVLFGAVTSIGIVVAIFLLIFCSF